LGIWSKNGGLNYLRTYIHRLNANKKIIQVFFNLIIYVAFIIWCKLRDFFCQWDVKNWDRESNKASQTEQSTDVLDFHESKMIHGS